MIEDKQYKIVKKLKIKEYKGHKLSFNERNIIRIYEKRIAKENSKTD